jgi:hypothetical protein
MSPFYTEGDSKLVGESVNKSMAKKILQPLSLSPPTKCEI